MQCALLILLFDVIFVSCESNLCEKCVFFTDLYNSFYYFQKMQPSFAVISWNVLHMIHEINYEYDASPVIARYSINQKWSNEKLRLNDIVKTLSELLIKHSSIEWFICLQEVPGDLIPMLHEMLDTHVASILATKPLMHVQTYSRKPGVRRRQGDSLYADPNESLVTIHYNPRSMSTENTGKYLQSDDRIQWTPCLADPGKGALTVTTISGLSVMNAHVPYDNQAAMVLLNNIPWPENNNPFVFVGDMNRDSRAFMRMIGNATVGKHSSSLLFPITTDKPTRVGIGRDGARHTSWIDHYVVSASIKDSAISPALVYDGIGDISDHYPILLQFKVSTQKSDL
jgi:endonuclease/exonuclease/phosphatase family metal-dependent hydrolase